MTPETEALIARVKEDYAPHVIPPCPVCKGPRDSVCSQGMGRIVYCCSSDDANPMSKGDRFEECMEHFSKSRWETSSRDPRIPQLATALEAAEKRADAAEAKLKVARAWIYGATHKEGCAKFNLRPKACSCGYDATLTQLEP